MIAFRPLVHETHAPAAVVAVMLFLEARHIAEIASNSFIRLQLLVSSPIHCDSGADNVGTLGAHVFVDDDADLSSVEYLTFISFGATPN
ncbi:hypothetical protein GN958_ATG13068 [Phytophthora infestans]|uniref:Uncharacterized protein n=1 Tax=Phytophthora infestans TaxID=4787 RepID=A0A8S9U9N3_PHYIN|nr:hypothetical protein GN958_ATG13068 [Phytophthora infestans]